MHLFRHEDWLIFSDTKKLSKEQALALEGNLK